MQYEYIQDSETLRQFCLQASKKSALAVDTEFVRTRTLYPQLGLIQLYDGERLLLVDPIADIDLAPLKTLLVDETVVKILHSCSEDLETFQVALGVMPAPLFDTQIALALLNQGNSVGYARMIEARLDIQLDKGESRTDWLARPLSQKQLEYAANDVLYLFDVYTPIRDEIQQARKLDWLYQEVELMKQKKLANLPTEYAYLAVKNNWRLRSRNLAVLQQLAKWRVGMAQDKNLALNFVVKEANLYEVARRLPQKKNDLFAISGMNPHEIRRYGETLLEIVDMALHMPPEHYPKPVERLNDFPVAKSMSKQIRELCEQVAVTEDVPVEMLASRKQIHQLLKWQWFEVDETRLSGLTPDLLTGWRWSLLSDGLTPIFDSQIKSS